MEFRKTAYQEKISIVDWNRIFEGIPRKNLEGLLFDVANQGGVLHGLDVVPNTPAGLSVVVQPGRGVYRDTATKRGKVMECFANTVVNLSAFVPGTGQSIVYVYGEQLVDTTSEAPITPPNAPALHPSYDGAYTPAPFDPLVRDNITISAGTANPATGGRIILAAVQLSAGQTTILANHILYGTRELAGTALVISSLKTRLDSAENLLVALQTAINDHVDDATGAHQAGAISVAEIDGLTAEDVQMALAQLRQQVATLQTAYAGRFVRVATSTYGDGGSPVWRLYRTRGTDGTGANAADWNNDKTIGKTGSGADIIWTALDGLPNETTLALSITSNSYNFATANIKLADGSVTSLAAIEPVIENPSSPTGIPQKLPWLVVKTDATGKFKVRASIGSFSTNNFHDFALYLQGYFY
jgi:hypothetical protein